ncbi:hypothetical protein A0H81_14107 [Grifola frondosa]|uniref:Uncharacterized protein n=1 Tax=Grifola frondosa TaxID=5627 RepID=A0A1C7LPD2_GRIFR|nr:hypothetical protein A0H81_14107 [Grifola frondosa]
MRGDCLRTDLPISESHRTRSNLARYFPVEEDLSSSSRPLEFPTMQLGIAVARLSPPFRALDCVKQFARWFRTDTNMRPPRNS